jgi:hypothetical protein
VGRSGRSRGRSGRWGWRGRLEVRERVGALGGAGLVEDVGDQAGDVVGRPGVEGTTDQLDRGEVGGALGEDRAQVVVVEGGGGTVGADEEAVAGLQGDDEQVGLGLVDAVDGLEDEVAVGVDPRLGLGDAALVDQALDEGVVAREPADLALAQEVGAAVADVADADLPAVEVQHGGGGAGAVERRLLVDDLADPVVGAVQCTAHPAEQLVGLHRPGGLLVELAQLLQRDAGGDVSAHRAADAVADGEQPGAGVPGVLVVLADAPHVGDRRPLQAQGRGGRARGARGRTLGRVAHLRSSRIVLPIRTCVPSVIVVGWVIRTVPM